MTEVYDLIVLGAGISGMAAAVEVQKSGKQALLIDTANQQSNLSYSKKIQGYPKIEYSGIEFVNDLAKQIQLEGCRIELSIYLKKIEIGRNKISISTQIGDFEAGKLIIATGASYQMLEAEGELPLIGHGVSYLPIENKEELKGKEVIVFGDTQNAMNEVVQLSNFCSRINWIWDKKTTELSKEEIEKLESHPTVEIYRNKFAVKILKEDNQNSFKALAIQDKLSGRRNTLHADRVIVLQSKTPNTQFLKGQLKLDQEGFVITNKEGKTNCSNVFAIGECVSIENSNLNSSLKNGRQLGRYIFE